MLASKSIFPYSQFFKDKNIKKDFFVFHNQP